MWVEDGILYVQLPDAEIFMATLDNEKSYVYDRETGILTQGSVNWRRWPARRRRMKSVKLHWKMASWITPRPTQRHIYTGYYAAWGLRMLSL